jgi:K+-transporting ATPase ATPase A chain
VGLHLTRAFAGEVTFLDPVCRPVETRLYRWLRIDPAQEMTAPVYFLCFFAFSVLGAAFLFFMLMLQRWLPGGPDASYLPTPMTPDLALNTSVSFATTTTWQAYGGESTLRYLTQVLGLTTQNFLAGAAGLAIGVAFIRGFARENSRTIGNFWVDLVRSLLWVLLPLPWIGGLLLVWQGVPLNLSAYAQASTKAGTIQTIAQGPVAVLEFIKNLGTNGGGFFNANDAHPYENPTPLANFLELLAIAVLPAALPITFGRMVNRPRAGWLLLTIMVVLFIAGLIICDLAECAAPRRFVGLGIVGGNM